MFRRDAFSFGFSATFGAAIMALLLWLAWYFLRAAGDIIGPFIAAAAIALILDPIVTFFQTRVTRGGRMRAVLIVFLFFLGVFGALLSYVVPGVAAQAQHLVRFFTPVTYTVKRLEGQSGRYHTLVQGLADSSAVITGLSNGQEYTFVVFAVHTEGEETPSRPVQVTPRADSDGEPREEGASDDATGPTMPGPDAPDTAPATGPGALTAEPGDRFVRLRWRAPVAGKSGFDQLREEADRWLAKHQQIGPIKLPPNIDSITTQYSEQFANYIKNFANRFASVIAGSIAGLINLVLIPIITVYILADIDRLRARLFFLMPEQVRGHALTATAEVGGVFGNYLRGLVVVCSLYAVSSFVALMVVSFWFPAMRGYALLLGFMAGLLYAVPYVGALAILVLAAVAALATGSGTWALLITAGVLLVLNQAFDMVVYPRVVGGEVGLHPLMALFALLLGGNLMGLWGMLLSVPAAASVQVILFRLFPRIKAPTPLSLLMKPREEGPPAPAGAQPAAHAAAKAAASAEDAASAAGNAAEAADAARETVQEIMEEHREPGGGEADRGAPG